MISKGPGAKRKIFNSFYWPIIFDILLLAAVVLTRKMDYGFYIVSGFLLLAIIRPFTSDRKYLVSVSTITDSIYIQYMTPRFRVRSVEFQIPDLEKMEKSKVNWITRQPASIILSFKKGWVEFYLPDIDSFHLLSSKFSPEGHELQNKNLAS